MQPMPPCPAPTYWCWTLVSGLLLCWQLWLGTYSVRFFFFSPSYVALWDSKTPHRLTCERVSYCVETSPPLELFPVRISIPNSFDSLFVFYICFLMSCLSGCLVFSASIQKWFCGSCSAFKWSFPEFVGEKVVSLSYSSAIFPFFLFKSCEKSVIYMSIYYNSNEK